MDLREAPLKRALQGLLHRSDRLVRELNSPATRVDARRQPRCFTVRWGPIRMQSARRFGDAGFEFLATLVNPGVYLAPNYPQRNALVGQYGPFMWVSTNMSVELGWTNTDGDGPIDPRDAGALFDPAILNNGGAIILDNFTGTPQYAGAVIRPRLGVEIDLYDKTRGRSITNGRVGSEAFVGGAYGFKELPEPCRFEHGTELEPRLYVTEARVAEMETDDSFNDARVAFWLTMVFKGYTVIDAPAKAVPL